VTFTIPSCIKAGHYFLRHELIALVSLWHGLRNPARLIFSVYLKHAAGSPSGAQLYVILLSLSLIPYRVSNPLLQMECAQIQITGGGSASPSTVTFPGAYSSKLSTLS